MRNLKFRDRKLCVVFLFVFLLLSVVKVSSENNYPQRIISLGPALTEELYLLGLGSKLVGNTVYCKIPPEAKNKEKIGTVIDVNIEKIISLEPDLVLATSLTDSKTIDKLKNVRIKVVKFNQPKNFNEICEHVLRLGKITGKEKEAKKIIKIARDGVNIIRKKVEKLQKPKVFIQLGSKPLFTVTGDSFVNDFIEFGGGINIVRKLKSGLYNIEDVLKKNPDVIIIPTMGIIGEQEKKNWQKFKTLNAARNNRIYIIDSYKICSPTPVSFVETLREMVEILHPVGAGM